MSDDQGTGATAPRNHFNYFTDIESEFVRRRGKHCLVSPLDWTIIQTWKEADIPLHIVLRGINQAFDNRETTKKSGTVNSISYCLQAVEKAYAAYRETQIGAHAETTETARTAETEFSPRNIREFLGARYDELRQLEQRAWAGNSPLPVAEALSDACRRLQGISESLKWQDVIDMDGLEHDLSLIEDLILIGIEDSTTAEQVATIDAEGQGQLKSYKKTMSKDIYQKTVNTFVVKRLRELHGIPRLSLFYMV